MQSMLAPRHHQDSQEDSVIPDGAIHLEYTNPPKRRRAGFWVAKGEVEEIVGEHHV